MPVPPRQCLFRRALVTELCAFFGAQLSADTACNFESLRTLVQGAFHAVSLDIRMAGCLDASSAEVLEAIEDYLALVEASLAHQAVAAAMPMKKAPGPEAVRTIAGELAEAMRAGGQHV